MWAVVGDVAKSLLHVGYMLRFECHASLHTSVANPGKPRDGPQTPQVAGVAERVADTNAPSMARSSGLNEEKAIG